MIKNKPHFLHYFNILSLDVAVGAWASGNMIARWLDITLPFAWQWSFPLTVWVIYTADHLLDAYLLKEKSLSPRHFFHFQHFNIIFIIWAITFLLLMICLPFQMPSILVKFGFIMGGISLLHFYLVKSFSNKISTFQLKEWGVGFIYFLGVVFPPILIKYTHFQEFNPANYLSIQQILLLIFPEIALQLGVFFFIIMMNILLFSCFEMKQDQIEGQSSWSQVLGENQTQKLILSFAFVNLLTLIVLYLQSLCPVHTILILSILTISMILPLIFPDFFTKNERYRTLCDSIFLICLFG